MQHFTTSAIQQWERFYRANLINSLSGFKSASLIATVNKDGVPNVAIFSNIVHIGADPALIGFINRPREAAPHTIANIETTGVYTINSIHASFIDKAHQTSAKYAEGESEFEATGLTPLYRPAITVPFVAESKIQYALELKEIVPITYNNTFLVIGAVTDIFLEEGLIMKDGFIAAEQAHTITTLGIDGYYEPVRLQRFAYAKKDKPASTLDR